MTETSQEKLSYQKVLDGLLRMHQLFVQGKRKSEEVKQLRNDIDEPYSNLTEQQREEIEGLSTDLFDVEKVLSEPALGRASSAEEKEFWAIAAQREGRFDEALSLFRGCRSSVPFSRISYHRGQIWEQKGQPKVAKVFFDHAVLLNPNNEEYVASAVSSLFDAFPERGDKELLKKMARQLRNLEGTADIRIDVAENGVPRAFEVQIRPIFPKSVTFLADQHFSRRLKPDLHGLLSAVDIASLQRR
jgi:tetratricopeptide (TPR) repeat protein